MKNWTITLKIPVIGLGCGVLGLHLTKVSVNIGKYASTLLRALEYRGYDSTGAAFQGDDQNITLLKDVGAPSTLVETLGIDKQAGKIFCGQVRWATFGIVSKVNAQPHEVKCKRHLFGAHNGNITNTRELKEFLTAEGHEVKSDNDGEMVVHAIEHYFNIELGRYPEVEQIKTEIRRYSMRQAILLASKKMIGSYAAVIVDPITQTSYAIKAGSSLYFGIGTLEEGQFSLASSDLTAVLKFTKQLVKLREGEFVEYTSEYYQVYAYKNQKIKRLNLPDLLYNAGDKVESKPARSKLRAEDTELLPDFNYFMEQEIWAEPLSSGKLIKLFLGGSNTGKRMLNLLEKESLLEQIDSLSHNILANDNYSRQLELFNEFVDSEVAENLFNKIKQNYKIIYEELVKEDFEKKYFFSNEKNTYIDLLGVGFDKKKLMLAKALDSVLEKHEAVEFHKTVDKFLELIDNTIKNNRNIYTLACGTSFHATKVAAMFFNEIANIEIIPILPGDFRGQYSSSLKENDVIVGVSQSGETKDLIDVFNDIDNLNLDIKKIVLVNNMNSTLGQEKSDVSIPILCGPEIAVPATKSFINQITLFFFLAIKVAEMHLMKHIEKDPNDINIPYLQKNLDNRYKQLKDIPQLLRETIATTSEQLDSIAEMIYMEPSMHILATKMSGVAKEGALKIRETVLNHTEGGEASEFKHGPNTILGKNTVFGMKGIKGMFKNIYKVINEIHYVAKQRELSAHDTQEIILAMNEFIFNRKTPFNLSLEATKLFNEVITKYDFFDSLFRNYPLIYVTGPDDRDVNLTISQINTHKIRGADTFVIAEDNDALLDNARMIPNIDKYYGWGFVSLPKTGDSVMTAFSSTVALQLLGLKMSIKKMAYLDRLNIEDHGVHPDVPKNVSKSITVD